MSARRDPLERRLGKYWKMEAANAVIVPSFLWWLGRKYGGLGWASGVALVPVVLLLVIGAVYWRAKYRQLRGERGLEGALRSIARLRVPSLVLIGVAIAAAAIVQVRPDFAASPGDRWVALAAAVLAVLECVNYYHRQLQHFDHLADIRRLLTGRGFRRSQMARDLARLNAATERR